jgi:hypothetical protein
VTDALCIKFAQSKKGYLITLNYLILMNSWIEFDMLMSELRYHRNIAQGRISEFKKIEKPSSLDRRRYNEAVGEESVLMFLQVWCNDFKFSTDEVKEIIKEKMK